MIVNDNPSNHLAAAEMLQEFDVQTDTACDGAEAVTTAERFNYDLILMDVRMPEMERVIRTRGGRQPKCRSLPSQPTHCWKTSQPASKRA